MTREQFYTQLKARFQGLLYANKIENDLLSVSCRALTPEEAIGSTTVRQDFPILTGKDIMLQAECCLHKCRNGFSRAMYWNCPLP